MVIAVTWSASKSSAARERRSVADFMSPSAACFSSAKTEWPPSRRGVTLVRMVLYVRPEQKRAAGLPFEDGRFEAGLVEAEFRGAAVVAVGDEVVGVHAQRGERVEQARDGLCVGFVLNLAAGQAPAGCVLAESQSAAPGRDEVHARDGRFVEAQRGLVAQVVDALRRLSRGRSPARRRPGASSRPRARRTRSARPASSRRRSASRISRRCRRLSSAPAVRGRRTSGRAAGLSRRSLRVTFRNSISPRSGGDGAGIGRRRSGA